MVHTYPDNKETLGQILLGHKELSKLQAIFMITEEYVEKDVQCSDCYSVTEQMNIDSKEKVFC